MLYIFYSYLEIYLILQSKMQSKFLLFLKFTIVPSAAPAACSKEQEAIKTCT